VCAHQLLEHGHRLVHLVAAVFAHIAQQAAGHALLGGIAPLTVVAQALVQAYEARHYPIDAPDPVEAIKFRMEQSGLTVKDLEPIIGRPNRVYEVLSRKRPLTLAMIRRLHRSLGIPAEVLIAESVRG